MTFNSALVRTMAVCKRAPFAHNAKPSNMPQKGNIAGQIAIAATFLAVADTALAQRTLPETLDRTVTVQYVTFFGGALGEKPRPPGNFTLLTVFPSQIGHSRYAPHFLAHAMTITFFAHAPLYSLKVHPVYRSRENLPNTPAYNEPNTHILSSVRCEEPGAPVGVAYTPGIHSCTFSLDGLWATPSALSKSRSQIGDRVGAVLGVQSQQDSGADLVLVTVPVRSLGTDVKRSIK